MSWNAAARACSPATASSLSLRSLAIGALPMVRSCIARSSCRRYAASSLVVKAPTACGGCGALGWSLAVMPSSPSRSQLPYKFRPGQMIPSESTLIDEYEISRSTARRAVALLRDQGIVETRIRRGSFVAGGRT
jgi:hypothetical protein